MSNLTRASSTADNFVELWFRLVKGSDGYPNSQDWEELWARPSGDTFVLESIPFFENRVSRGDVVTATCHDDGILRFDSVIERGGHSTFHVYINSAEVSVEQFRAELKQRGADSEVTLQKLIAVDIPARAFQIVEEFLVRGKDAGRWELQDGYIFESSPDESHIGGQPQSN